MTSRTTILRVKRPRTLDPVDCLQFTGTKRARGSGVHDLVAELGEADLAATTESGTFVWKRIETSVNNDKKRSVKLVHATLAANKRQRLELTLSAAADATPLHKKKRKNAILDPLSRLVNDKLMAARDGSCTLQDYLEFLEQDERIPTQRFLPWALLDSGETILHVGALLNATEQVQHVLVSPSRGKLEVNAIDHSGMTALQVAHEIGHANVAQVLCAFGADDVVYDEFLLSTDTAETTTYTAAMVQLLGGVGYMNEAGELILEAHEEQNGVEQESDVDDDDEDSNHEDHVYNDYPEEPNEDDDDSDGGDDVDFRHSAIYDRSAIPLVDLEDEYDAQYGLYGNHDDDDANRMYAYDPNEEEEEDDDDYLQSIETRQFAP